MATGQFIITDAGLDAALRAEQQGLKIKIVDFILGDGYGYDPQVSDTKLHGNLLYKGKPSKYKYIDPHTKLIVCVVPVEAGPFTYGEIGLVLEDGTLFALCALDSPVEKFSSLESPVASSATFNCLLAIDRGGANVTIDYEDDPSEAGVKEVDIVDKWTTVNTPTLMGMDAFIEELIVQEQSPDNRQTLLLRDIPNDRWNVASTWEFLNEAKAKSKSTTHVEFDDNVIVDISYIDPESGHYLLQHGNQFRVATGSKNGNSFRLSYVDALDMTGSIKVFHLGMKTMQYISLVAKNIMDTIRREYVTLATDQTITGQKTFTKTILGVAQYAQWADLAEFYEADFPYAPGTLIAFGGSKEITAAFTTVNGVVSTKPGFALNSGMMNSGVPVALCGRVPVRVSGRVERFDRIVLSDIPGIGVVNNKAPDSEVVARALRSKHTNGEGLVLCVTRFVL